MRIFFTDKLSKMVAHYENLSDMYIWIEHSFDTNTSWGPDSLKREVFNIMDKTYWQKKPRAKKAGMKFEPAAI